MDQPTVVFFDGLCNLCSTSVQRIIAAEKKDTLRFSSLQGRYAAELAQTYLELQKVDSIVLLENGRIFVKSTAILKLIKYLKWYYSILNAGWILPATWRDQLYDWVAKNRYKWFGKKTNCWLPSLELKQRFIE